MELGLKGKVALVTGSFFNATHGHQTKSGPAVIRSFPLPVRTEAITVSQMWHPRFDADPAQSVAVLFGAGGAFCAGFDLKYAASMLGKNNPMADLDFPAGDGQSFRTFSPGDSAGFSRRHHQHEKDALNDDLVCFVKETLVHKRGSKRMW